jgi:hypothetical protein
VAPVKFERLIPCVVSFGGSHSVKGYRQQLASIEAKLVVPVPSIVVKGTIWGCRFQGWEHISHLFSFELDLIADNSATVDFSKLVGKEMTLAVATPGQDSETEWRIRV